MPFLCVQADFITDIFGLQVVPVWKVSGINKIGLPFFSLVQITMHSHCQVFGVVSCVPP